MRNLRVGVVLAAVWAVAPIDAARSAEAVLPEVEMATPAQDNRATSIAGARKEFETIKSLKGIGSEVKGETPRFAVPAMPADAPPGGPSPSRNSPRNSEKPTSNWLVDAMAKNQSAKSDRGTDPRLPVSGASGQEKMRAQDDRPPGRPDKPSADRSSPTNPFSRYLGVWISPQDYALLKPALEPAAAMSGARSGTGAEQGIAPAFSPLGSLGPKSTSDSLLAQVPPSGRGGTDRSNPYLEAVTKPAPIAGVQTAAVPVKSKAPSPGPAPLEPPSVQPPVRTPDPVRPGSDEKYFKQLKRF